MVGKVLPIVRYIPDSGRCEAKSRHWIWVENCLSVASKSDGEVRGEYSAVVVELIMNDVKKEDTRHVEAGIFTEDDERRAIYLFYFVCTNLLIRYSLCMTDR